MINKKKEYLFGSTADQNEYEEIEFASIRFQDQFQFQNDFHFIFAFHFDFTTSK
jgi:hypothetical protein